MVVVVVVAVIVIIIVLVVVVLLYAVENTLLNNKTAQPPHKGMSRKKSGDAQPRTLVLANACTRLLRKDLHKA